MTGKSVLFAISLLLVLSHCRVCLTDTWYVNTGATGPRDGRSPETGFQRIQQWIDAASNGDTVIFAGGAYLENIKFKGGNIVLRSSDPVDPTVVTTTITDGKQTGPVVTFIGNEDQTCVLSGFTIRNGKGDIGAGIVDTAMGFSETHPTIEYNTIVENSAYQGGEIALCDGLVSNNTIVGNSAFARGAGLRECNGILFNNIIKDNSAEWYGGGLSFCSAPIRNSLLSFA